MKYRVKCSNCGGTYLIESDGNRTVRSVCPHCGHKMLVNLPEVNAGNARPSAPQAGNEYGDEPQKKGNGWVKFLIAVILGLAIGVGVWAFVQYRQNADEQARIALKEARKAHADSLMMLRHKQEAEEQAASKAASDQHEVIGFLTDFYTNCIYGDGNPDDYSGNLSEKCFEKLHDASSDDPNSIDWKLLDPHFDTGDGSEDGETSSPESFRVEHDKGNWYRVCYVSHGMTEVRRIEALLYNGKVIINDFQ